MAVSSGIILIVLGAILRFGVTADTPGLDLDVIGMILMIGGAIGAVIGLVYSMTARSRAATYEEHRTADGGRVVHTETHV